MILNVRIYVTFNETNREREWKEKEDKRIAEKERASMYATISPSKSVSAVSSSWKSLPSSAALEGLHTALKQKEGELANLQALLASTDKQKCTMRCFIITLFETPSSKLTLYQRQFGGRARLPDREERRIVRKPQPLHHLTYPYLGL